MTKTRTENTARTAHVDAADDEWFTAGQTPRHLIEERLPSPYPMRLARDDQRMLFRLVEAIQRADCAEPGMVRWATARRKWAVRGGVSTAEDVVSGRPPDHLAIEENRAGMLCFLAALDVVAHELEGVDLELSDWASGMHSSILEPLGIIEV